LNSASEANELALRLSRAFTGNKDTIVTESAYHGNTTTLIDISPYKHEGPGGLGAPDWVHKVPVVDTYRGIYTDEDPEAVNKYAQSVKNVIDNIEASGKKLSAFIAETYPSVGGQIIVPKGYLSKAYQYVRDAGGLCVADEVQTCYGRIGTDFYAFEEQGVVPDIVVLGKPIGNGHPLAAVVTRQEIANRFNNGMEFFSTFGGSTLSCVVGRKVLEVTQKEKLQSHALAVGEKLLEGFEKLKDKYQIIGDVRGSGFFLGIELVRNRDTLEPADAEATDISNALKDAGILIGTDGPYHNVLKIRPPMPFDNSNAEELLNSLNEILKSKYS
jgi:4-aminobutyrate aminotransferase-like enzyme